MDFHGALIRVEFYGSANHAIKNERYTNRYNEEKDLKTTPFELSGVIIKISEKLNTRIRVGDRVIVIKDKGFHVTGQLYKNEISVPHLDCLYVLPKKLSLKDATLIGGSGGQGFNAAYKVRQAIWRTSDLLEGDEPDQWKILLMGGGPVCIWAYKVLTNVFYKEALKHKQMQIFVADHEKNELEDKRYPGCSGFIHMNKHYCDRLTLEKIIDVTKGKVDCVLDLSNDPIITQICLTILNRNCTLVIGCNYTKEFTFNTYDLARRQLTVTTSTYGSVHEIDELANQIATGNITVPVTDVDFNTGHIENIEKLFIKQHPEQKHFVVFRAIELTNGQGKANEITFNNCQLI